jgi:formylglycine-generating enzyme required for sulfatase activity
MAKVVLDPNAKDGAGVKPSSAAYCMDAYEFPGKGQPPKTGVSQGAAAKACKDAGKRLCSGDEWTKACDAEYEASQCNVGGKLAQPGSFPACKTAAGVFDLVGNAGEWTSDGRLHGGDASTGKSAGCKYATKHFAPKASDGFRCCADAQR